MNPPDSDISPTPGGADARDAAPRSGGGRYVISTADVRADKDEIIELTFRVLPDSPGESRYRKYYESNPNGPPFVLLARERETGRLVGMATLFPAPLRVRGESMPAAISADFAIDPDHRGFGPALALQRAAVASLADHGLVCTYGAPNPFSEPVVTRVGFAEVGELTRFLKVLRTRLAVDLLVRRRRLNAVLSALSRVTADPLLPLVFRERRGRGAEFAVERPAAFDERFRALWEETERRHAVSGERSPELLNWKYELGGASPSEFRIFAVVDPRGEVAGYVVHRSKDDVRHIFDIACTDSRAALDALLGEFLRDARRERAAGVTWLYAGSDQVLSPRLRSFGFLSRQEDKRLRVCVAQGAEPELDLLDIGNWHFQIGDDDF
jgi:hypothetical protein